MENLPSDVLRKIALDLSPPDVIKFCQSNKRQNQAICNSQDFWRMKSEKDYPEYLHLYKGDGQQFYKEKFTQTTNLIEEIYSDAMNRMYGKNMEKYLTEQYKKELYRGIYETYTEGKKVLMKDDYRYELNKILASKISHLIPAGIDYDNEETHPMLNILYYIDGLLTAYHIYLLGKEKRNRKEVK